jgi:phosphoribosyl-ATP pyrophosphohydrolase
MTSVLEQLEQVLVDRRNADPEQSYVASLYALGLNKILEKVGEESTEVILAAKDAHSPEQREDLVYEVADLWFHLMVLLAQQNLSYNDVELELARRFGLSGLTEKANRTSDSKEGQ